MDKEVKRLYIDGLLGGYAYFALNSLFWYDFIEYKITMVIISLFMFGILFMFGYNLVEHKYSKLIYFLELLIIILFAVLFSYVESIIAILR